MFYITFLRWLIYIQKSLGDLCTDLYAGNSTPYFDPLYTYLAFA